MEAPITRTCSLALAAFVLAAPLQAAPKAHPIEAVETPALTYFQARAAEMAGDHARSANLFALLADQTNDSALTERAIRSAIGAGELDLALRLSASVPAARLPIEAKLLLIAEQLRKGDNAAAIAQAGNSTGKANPSFLLPLLNAWNAAERKRLPDAMAALDSAPANGLIAPFRDEHRALILLRMKHSGEAAPLAERALTAAGGRRGRLRMVFADAFLRAGDRARALSVITLSDDPSAIARIRAGKPLGQRIDSTATAFSEFLTGIALDLSSGGKEMPIALLQVARRADPRNSGAALLQGLVMEADGRADGALAVWRSVRAEDALATYARTYETRLLAREERFDEALTTALPLAKRRDAALADHQRLGDVYRAMKRYDAAADSYGRAVAAAHQQPAAGNLWPLYYDRAGVLERAGRWEEAKRDLNAALALAPDQPVILNFLGYAKLEHGEDLDLAEAMIRKASSLAPDEAAITDSLGWALFKRGRLPEAIATLQKAAAKDNEEAEIHEHLGDALYSAGRRYEARFAWSAALITAEEAVAKRLREKLQIGLTPATAAP